VNGSEIKAWRKSLRFTQEQASREFEVTRATVQNWEYEITPVPWVVALATRQISRREKRRPEYGPVTLVYLDTAPAGDEALNPKLFCERFADNRAALLGVLELKKKSEAFSRFILDDTGSVIWSGLALIDECEKAKLAADQKER
jgi:transcriptional regulator with XRE-family HTH domain